MIKSPGWDMNEKENLFSYGCSQQKTGKATFHAVMYWKNRPFTQRIPIQWTKENRINHIFILNINLTFKVIPRKYAYPYMLLLWYSTSLFLKSHHTWLFLTLIFTHKLHVYDKALYCAIILGPARESVLQWTRTYLIVYAYAKPRFRSAQNGSSFANLISWI